MNDLVFGEIHHVNGFTQGLPPYSMEVRAGLGVGEARQNPSCQCYAYGINTLSPYFPTSRLQNEINLMIIILFLDYYMLIHLASVFPR